MSILFDFDPTSYLDGYEDAWSDLIDEDRCEHDLSYREGVYDALDDELMDNLELTNRSSISKP